MIDPRFSRALRWATFTLLACTLALAGYWLLFSTFMIYDDEGYVLVSLRNFSIHGGLYDQVYTQYGPFPYLVYDTLHRILGFTFNNTTGRWITLINWLGSSAICAKLIHRTTRSGALTAFTFVGTFTYLWVMIHEPLHPGGLITLIVTSATWLGAEAWQGRRFAIFAAVTGLACAALLLTKINVGLFFCGAVISWLVLNSDRSSTARILTWAIAVGCAALPYALMHTLIREQWVRIFALVFAAGALGSLLAGQRVSHPIVDSRMWLQLFAWSGAGLIILGSLTLCRGTSLHGLISGIVLDPLKQPKIYFFPVHWRAGSCAVAVTSLILVAGASQFRLWDNRRLMAAVAIFRILAAIVCLIIPLGLIPATLAVWGLSYGISLAWLFVIPLGKDTQSAAIRSWVSLVLVFQSLQAYPVAGSQLNWGTCLWLPLLALGVHDAASYVSNELSAVGNWTRRFSAAAVGISTVFMARQLTEIGWNNYHFSQPLGLRGAENIRLPNDITYALRIANENLRAHSDVLFSFPGLYSANLWTGLPTPTLANATHWFSLLSLQRQQEIIDRMANSPKAAIFVARDLLDYLERHGFRTTGPLHDWLMQHFTKAMAFGGYEIWVQRGRSIAPLSLAQPGFDSQKLLTSLSLTCRAPSTPIKQIELCDIDRPDTPLITFSSQNTSTTTTQLGLDGRPSARAFPAVFPLELSGVARITLNFSGIRVSDSVSRLLLVLRDANHNAIGELLVVE